MSEKKRIHLLCNAHIDPIWQWGWDEGISAAIATFKSAADLAETHDFIFCHGESLLYEAIETHAPDLFERIKKLVKSGKWHITGGWYLQPDCLMPTGETFVRHHKVGNRYFKDKFGVDVKIATSYDAFGHSIGLAQILKKTGYEGYIVCRPWATQFEYPSRFFKWTGPDGSTINTTQTFSYSSSLGRATKKIEDTYKANAKDDIILAPWGVGNHGGGPSRKDLADISVYEIEGAEIFHSTPEALFDEAVFDSEVKRSLVTSNPGCYSSMAKIKQAYRKCENFFYSTEKMLSSLSLTGVDLDRGEFESAEKKLLLASFHDILPGSCVDEGEKEGLGLLSSCDKAMKDYRTTAFLRLVMEQEVAAEGEYPVFVYNYMPYTVETPVEVEFTLADQNRNLQLHYLPHVFDSEGTEIPCQQIKENSTINIDWRKRIIFTAKLAPLGITRFNVRVTESGPADKTAKPLERICFEKYTDLIKSPITLELYDDTADPWAMSDEEQKAVGTSPVDFMRMTPKQAQEFCAVKEPLAPLHITEEGSTLTEIEELLTCGKTNAVLKYKFYKNAPYFDVNVNVEFADKNKLVKIKIPTTESMKNAIAFGDGPYIVEQKPDCEVYCQKWLGKKNENGEVFAVINDGTYSGKVSDGYVYLTLIRGAGYCFHPIEEDNRELYPQDRYLPRIDSGRYVYNFRIMCSDVASVVRQADLFNSLPYAVNVFPIGGEKKQVAKVNVAGNVSVPVVRYDDGKLIMRVYNPCEKDEGFDVEIQNCKASDVASGGEVVSIVYENGNITFNHSAMII